MRKPKRSTFRISDHWRRIMRNRRVYYSIVLTSRPSHDIYPFVGVTILGECISGLIETGATVSGLSWDLALKIINDDRYKYIEEVSHRCWTSHSTVGRFSADITFHDRTESMSFFFIPSLMKSLYLGPDFVRKFRLAQDLPAPSVYKVDNVEDCNQHQLTTYQQARLDAYDVQV